MLFLIFLDTYSMDLKISFRVKIGLFELSNINVHQIYILWLHILWKIQFKNIFHTFFIYSNKFLIVKVFIFNFYRNSLNGFKNGLQRSDRTQRALQFCCTSNLHLMVASYWKIHLKRFSYTFYIHLDCDFTFTFSFWKSGTFWADCFNSKVAQLDKTFHLIYILRVVPGGVFNFTVSNLGEGGIKILISDSDSGAPTTPGTIEKGQKFDNE